MAGDRRLQRGAMVLIGALTAGTGLYFALWQRGGIRTGWGLVYSGSRVPAEAQGLSEEERRSQTEARARVILKSVLEFESRHGRLPASLSDLKAELTLIPVPLTSTLPFRYVAQNSWEFTIEWEAFPNAMYEKYWLDRSGSLHLDM